MSLLTNTEIVRLKIFRLYQNYFINIAILQVYICILSKYIFIINKNYIF